MSNTATEHRDERDLFTYQKQTVDFVVSVPQCMVMLPVGTGKTVIALTALKELMFDRFDIRKALVVSTIDIIQHVWPKEKNQWDHVSDLTMRIMRPTLDEELFLHPKADITLINFEQAKKAFGLLDRMVPAERRGRRARSKDMPSIRRDFDWGIDTLIIDESDKFKDMSTQRWRYLARHLDWFDRVILMTATPAPHFMMDLWAQYYFLDRGRRLGRNITQYRNWYFTKKPWSPKYELQYGAIPRIQKRVRDITISIDGTKYLKMPEIIRNRIPVDLPPKAMKQYRDMQREMVVAVSGGKTISAVHAGAMVAKLRCMANGFIYDENHDAQFIHDVKIKALRELLISELSAKVMIFYEHIEDRMRIMRLLKELYDLDKVPHLGGGETARDRAKAIAEWNADEAPCLLLHPKSAGPGLNLQGSSCGQMVWYSPIYSAGLVKQAEGRLNRQGQKNDTLVVHSIVANNTIDNDIIEAVKKRMSLQDILLKSLHNV